jgi:hypothetical protein
MGKQAVYFQKQQPKHTRSLELNTVTADNFLHLDDKHKVLLEMQAKLGANPDSAQSSSHQGLPNFVLQPSRRKSMQYQFCSCNKFLYQGKSPTSSNHHVIQQSSGAPAACLCIVNLSS